MSSLGLHPSLPPTVTLAELPARMPEQEMTENFDAIASGKTVVNKGLNATGDRDVTRRLIYRWQFGEAGGAVVQIR